MYWLPLIKAGIACPVAYFLALGKIFIFAPTTMLLGTFGFGLSVTRGVIGETMVSPQYLAFKSFSNCVMSTPFFNHAIGS